MSTLNARVSDFLAQRRVAVAGVSRTRQDAANLIYRRFKARGYQVFPVNPNAERVEGDPCFPDLRSIPGGVDGVVIVTRPTADRGDRASMSRGWREARVDAPIDGPRRQRLRGRRRVLPRQRHHGHRRRLPVDVWTDGGLRAQMHALDGGHDALFA